MLANDLKTGRIYQDNGEPYQVVKYSHSKVARGGATVKIRAKNLITGKVIDRSYSSNDSVEDADVYRKNAQYLYESGGGYVFMDPETYEQVTINAEVIGEESKFLKDDTTVQVLYFEGRPVYVELPKNIVYEIAQADPGYKGNTVSNVLKDATTVSGIKIKVPTFIKKGDKVKIDTRTGDYVSKA